MKMKKNNYLELGLFSKRPGLVEKGNISLANLSERILKHVLPKDQSCPRLSNWDRDLNSV